MLSKNFKNTVKIRFAFLLILCLFLFPVKLSAQCQEYIEAISESELEPYVLDGNFLSPIVSEGDSVELVRTLMAGTAYKIAVCGMDMFVKEITIIDNAGNILFKNWGDDVAQNTMVGEDGEEIPVGLNSWEYKPDASVNVKIKVKILPMAEDMDFKLEGCLGILVGFKK